MPNNRKKPYFRSRTISEIKDLTLSEINPQMSGLIRAIDGLDSSHSLVLSDSVIPQKFFEGQYNPARKAYKHGAYLPLEQKLTLSEVIQYSETPVRIREKSFERLRNMPESNINFLGYRFRPVSGRDKRERFVPFVWLVEGAKLFAYACQKPIKGIEVKIYDKAERVKTEGARAVLSVPSRTSGASRYEFRMDHITMISNQNNLATILSLSSSAPVEGSSKRYQMRHKDFDIRYTYENEREESDRMVFGPHDIAGYFGIIKRLVDEAKTSNPPKYPIPFIMCPFSISSQHQMEFYKRLENNVLVKDNSLKSKNKLRKKNLAEKSILLGRSLGIFGNDDFAFNKPNRDGRLDTYNSWNWNNSD